MSFNNKKVKDWFYLFKGKLTYSMTGSRNGTDGTADCSGAMSSALNYAGAKYQLNNTQTIGSYLYSLGYRLVQSTAIVNENTAITDDIVIMSEYNVSDSSGSGGHIGIIDGSNFVSVTATDWLTGHTFQKNNAVQVVPWNSYKGVTRLKGECEVWRYQLKESEVNKLTEDGFLGAQTIQRLQKFLGTIQDGKIDGLKTPNSKPSNVIKALQHYLNTH
jgi:hypothetical protein